MGAHMHSGGIERHAGPRVSVRLGDRGYRSGYVGAGYYGSSYYGYGPSYGYTSYVYGPSYGYRTRSVAVRAYDDDCDGDTYGYVSTRRVAVDDDCD